MAVFAPPVPIHLPHPVFPPLCLPPELRHQRTEDERVGGNESKEREGINGEGRCAIRCPHGLNMAICHEAESLRKDWLTFTADPRETRGKKTQPSKTPPGVWVQDEHTHMHTSMTGPCSLLNLESVAVKPVVRRRQKAPVFTITSLLNTQSFPSAKQLSSSPWSSSFLSQLPPPSLSCPHPARVINHLLLMSY